MHCKSCNLLILHSQFISSMSILFHNYAYIAIAVGPEKFSRSLIFRFRQRVALLKKDSCSYIFHHSVNVYAYKILDSYRAQKKLVQGSCSIVQ